MSKTFSSLKLQKWAAALIQFMLILLPFHAFLSVFFNFGLGISALAKGGMVFNFWKEGVLVLLSVIFIFYLGARKKENSTKKWLILDLTDKLLLGFFAFGILHFLLAKIGILQASSQFSLFIWGVKYDYLFLWSFFVAKHFEFNSQELKKFLKTSVVAGIVSLVLGFVLYFIVKPENLTFLGFRNDWSTWFPNQSLAFCQRVENLSLCRMSGTFAGPNQLGAYLTVLLPLLLLWYQQRKEWFSDGKNIFSKIFSERITVLICIVLAVVGLFFTFSRAAYIGTAMAMLILISFRYNLCKIFKKYWPLLTILILLLGIGLYLKKDIFLRPASSSGHFQALTLGAQQMLNHPLGQGLGTAGPASYHSSAPLIPENWYLQVGIELGFAGLIIFCALMASILQKLFQKNLAPFFAGFAALAIMAFFLHIYEDAPANLSFFLLLGAVLGKIENESSQSQI